MTVISRRECHLPLVKNEDLNRFVKEIASFLEEEKLPEGYTADVYKDQVVCCGCFLIGLAVEIEGANRQIIRDIDLKVYAKVLEVCERESVEYHEVSPPEVLTVED